MSIPAPMPPRQKPPRHGVQVLATVLGLTLMIALLGCSAEAASAGLGLGAPPAQGNTPAASDTGEQRSVRTYLESKGYDVNSVGYPTDSDGNVIPDWVAVDMVMASQNFDPKTGLEQDDTTINQVVYGFYALHRYYPDYPNLGVMLEWREFLLIFPITAETFQKWLDEEISPDDMWAEVMQNFSAYNTQTGEELGARDFGNKDFSGNGDNNQGIPPVDPNSGPTTGGGATDSPTGPLRIRLQPSSAYLPTDGDPIRLIATVNDAENRRVSNRDVQFTAATTGDDPQDLGSAATGEDGVARTDLRSTRELGQVSVAARPDTSDIDNQGQDIGASAAIIVGPAPRSDNDAVQAIQSSLQTSGYEIGEAGTQDESGSTGDTSTFAYVIERIASSKFDDAVRTQLLTSFGTLFRIYPDDVASARVGLVYSNGRNEYLLLYTLNRGDWTSFVNGDIDEGQIWQAIDLYTLDNKTGEPVDNKSFGDKNFVGGTSEDTIQRTVETKLVKESWGDQLYSAQISLAVGSYADSFKVVDKNGNGVFAIYEAADPTTPIYSSADDPDGSKLAALRLPTGTNPGGEYMLTISSGNPPSNVRMTYIEHTVR